MAEYKILHEPDLPAARKLTLLKNRHQIVAELTYSPGIIIYLSGRPQGSPDKEFVRMYGHTPAMELVMHAAHHSPKAADGSVKLEFVNPRKIAQNLLERAQKTGLLKDVNAHSATVKKIRLRLPPVQIKE